MCANEGESQPNPETEVTDLPVFSLTCSARGQWALEEACYKSSRFCVICTVFSLS